MVQKLVGRITGEYVECEALHQALRKIKRRVMPEMWSANATLCFPKDQQVLSAPPNSHKNSAPVTPKMWSAERSTRLSEKSTGV